MQRSHLFALAGAACLILLVIFFIRGGGGNEAPLNQEQATGTTQDTSGTQYIGSIISRLKDNSIRIQMDDNRERTLYIASSTQIQNILGSPVDEAIFETGDVVSVAGTARSVTEIDAQSIRLLDTPDPLELTQYDNGKHLSYAVTSRFTVVLPITFVDADRLACVPGGIVGRISNLPDVPDSHLGIARFEAVAPGTCTLSTGSYRLTITVTP